MNSLLRPLTALIGVLLTHGICGSAGAAEIDLKSLEPLETKKKATGGAYVGVFVGQTLSQSADTKLDYVGHTLEYDMLDRDGDLLIGFEVGYAWRTKFPIEFGLEFEALFGSTEIDSIVANGRNSGVPINLSDAATLETDMSYAAFMVNATVTLDLRKYRPQLGKYIPRIRPYAGFGIGGAQIWYRNQRVQTFGDVLGIPTGSSASPFSLDEFVFAHQIFAGLEYRMTDKLGVYTEYRQLSFDKVTDLETFKTNMIMGGLRWKY